MNFPYQILFQQMSDYETIYRVRQKKTRHSYFVVRERIYLFMDKPMVGIESQQIYFDNKMVILSGTGYLTAF